MPVSQLIYSQSVNIYLDSKSGSQPVIKTVSQAVNIILSQTVSQSVNLFSVSQSINLQSVSQPVSQSISQSVN